MKKLGHYLIEALAAQGVRHVFGIPGVHNVELYRGLAGGPIRHVTGRHEQGLGFMADGYARVSGLPGVCFTITGPGLTNIATAMGQAYGDSIPLLVISSQNKHGEAGSGRGFLHELPDQLGLARQVAAEAFAIGRPSDLPEALARAFARFAGGRPRPVYLEIPLDVLAMDASGLPLPARPAAPRAAEGAALAAAAARLKAARSPVVLAGGGALHAADEVRRLVEHLDAPLVMTVNARGLLPPGHPLAVPMSPSLRPIRQLVASADAVVAVGTELGPTDYDMYAQSDFPQPPGLIRLEVDAEQMRRSATPEVALLGDARATLDRLLALDLGAGRRAGGAERARSACRGALESIASLSADYPRHLDLLAAIRDALPTALLVGDSTQLVYAGNLGFNAATAGSWFNSATGYGTLGYALPASTGAGLAAPERPVVCLVGDGGMQFSMSELAVLREVDAWTAVLVWNNHGYAEIKNSMLQAGVTPEGVDVLPPDFEHLAHAYGYAYRRVGDAAMLGQALRAFGARRQVLLLEIAAADFA